MPAGNNIKLEVGGVSTSGWTSVRVTRGIERIPGDFEIEMSERFDGTTDVLVKPGDRCRVLIGSNPVITGYIDHLENIVGSAQHRVVVRGRGKCGDLVDCAAEWPGSQFPPMTAQGICEKLAARYNVNVRALVDTGEMLPQFALIHGESVIEVIDRVCRVRGLLVYEDESGDLLLTKAGKKKASGGFELGNNVLEASVNFRMDQCYSDYWAYAQAIDIFSDKGISEETSVHIKDTSVLRYRSMAIVTETGEGGYSIAKLRASWERNRRRARQRYVSLISDSWHDSSGELWAPNTQVTVSLPQLKIDKETLLIGEVSYRLGENGTTCEVLLMAPDAFVPAPLAPPDFNLIDVPGQKAL